jgi:general secretion pathway protein J
MRSPWPRTLRGRRARAVVTAGFTLIEVLVAMLILSVLATAAWKGMDAIGTAREVADTNLQQTLRVQSVMGQLEADLSQVIDTQVVRGLQFDGANLRLSRRSPAGVQVVVWTVREDRLLRWSSPEATRVGDLQDHWRRSQQLQGREPGTLVALPGVAQWQVYCFRGGSLSNCQSTGNVVQQLVGGGAGKAGGSEGGASSGGADTGSSGNAGAPSSGTVVEREQLPTAVRSQLTLADGRGLSGLITRDLMVAPQP